MSKSATSPTDQRRVPTATNPLPATLTVADDEPIPYHLAEPFTPLRPLAMQPRAFSEDMHVLVSEFNPDRPTLVQYDPAQISAEIAEATVRCELDACTEPPHGLVVCSGGSLILAPLPEGEPMRVTALPDGTLRSILDTGQAPAQQALELLRRKREENAGGAVALPAPGACRTYGWCIHTEAHTFHHSAEIAIPARDGQGMEAPYLDVQFMAEDERDGMPGSPPFVAFNGDRDLTADELRAEVVKIRAHCDRLDAVADQLTAEADA